MGDTAISALWEFSRSACSYVARCLGYIMEFWGVWSSGGCLEYFRIEKTTVDGTGYAGGWRGWVFFFSSLPGYDVGCMMMRITRKQILEGFGTAPVRERGQTLLSGSSQCHGKSSSNRGLIVGAPQGLCRRPNRSTSMAPTILVPGRCHEGSTSMTPTILVPNRC